MTMVSQKGGSKRVGTNTRLFLDSLKQYQTKTPFRFTTDDCKLFQTCLKLCEPIGLTSTSRSCYRLTFSLMLATFCITATISHDYHFNEKFGNLMWVIRLPWTCLSLGLQLLSTLNFGEAQRWRCFRKSLKRLESCTRPFGYKSTLRSYRASCCIGIAILAQSVYKGYSVYSLYADVNYQDLPSVIAVFVVYTYVCLVFFFTYLTARCLKGRFDVVTGKLFLRASTLKYGDLSRFLIASNELCESFDKVLGTKLVVNCCLCVADAVLVFGGTVITGVNPTSVQIVQLAFQMGVLVFVIFECDAALNSGRRFTEACYHLLDLPGIRSDQLLSLGRLSERLGPIFSPGGFFIIDRSVSVTFLYAILAYLVIVVQATDSFRVLMSYGSYDGNKDF